MKADRTNTTPDENKDRKLSEFVDEVAKDILSGLSQKDKDYIFLHPDSTTHHFGMGMWIRNKYIHGRDTGFEDIHPDDLSSMITSRLASLIIDNYDYENPFYRWIYDSFDAFIFSHLRRLYFAMNGECPDDILAKYEDLPDSYEAAEKAKKEIRDTILDPKRFKQYSLKYGLTNNQYQKSTKVIDAHNKENWDVIPYDIALLTSRKLEPAFRQQLLCLMEAVLKQTPRMSIDLPGFVFNQKDAALLAVSARGTSLKRFKRFNNDDEVIKAALSNDGEAIQYVRKELRDTPDYIRLALSDKYNCALKKRCMAKYRDNDEMVKVALKANGCHIEYASDRIKDDLELAKYAITHQTNWYPSNTVCHLSTRLRDTMEIALLDIREGNASVDDYSKRLRDSDEIAEALIESDQKWLLYLMSERIQKKYDHDIESEDDDHDIEFEDDYYDDE